MYIYNLNHHRSWYPPAPLIPPGLGAAEVDGCRSTGQGDEKQKTWDDDLDIYIYINIYILVYIYIILYYIILYYIILYYIILYYIILYYIILYYIILYYIILYYIILYYIIYIYILMVVGRVGSNGMWHTVTYICDICGKNGAMFKFLRRNGRKSTALSANADGSCLSSERELPSCCAAAWSFRGF